MTARSTSDWAWRGYSGSNPHIAHTHVSVSLDLAGYDSRQPWGLTDTPPSSVRPTLRKGSTGQSGRELQHVLNRWYPSLPQLTEDGVFGQRTEDRVKHFQRKSGVAVDGVVGPVTWHLLGFR